jgi:TRAP-type C4-dicarboxylate transport system substrate-binding protein
LFEALERGIVSGTAPMTIATTPSLGIPEVAPNVTRLGLGNYATASLMFSQKTWDDLPKDVQDIMLEVSGEFHEGETPLEKLQEYASIGCQAYREHDAKFTLIEQVEIDQWRAPAADKVEDVWLNNVTAAGVAEDVATEFLAQYETLTEQYADGNEYVDGVTACAEGQ